MAASFSKILLFLFIHACLAVAAWRFARRWLAEAGFSETILAAGVLFFAETTVLGAILGFSGLIKPEFFALAAALPAFASLFLKIPQKQWNFSFRAFLRLPFPVLVLAGIAMLGLLFLTLWAVVTHPPPGGDGYIYHLYFPASWLASGRIGYIPLPYGVQAASYYPLNTELFYLWLMLPLREDLLTNTAQIPALVLCALCVYAMARRLGAALPGAVAGAACVLLIPGFVQQAAVARVDMFFSLWFLVSIFFMINWSETGQFAHLALAAASWGLFLGTKSLAVPYSVCIFVPFCLVLFSSKVAGRRFLSVFVTFLLLIACGGFWYIRNGLVTGNPFYPLEFSVAGLRLFAGAYSREAMKVFHESNPRVLLDIVNLFLSPGLAAVAGVCVLFSIKNSIIGLKTGKKWTLPYAALLPLLVLGLFWFVNPHNNLTNGRFLFPGFAALCVCAAVAIDDGKTVEKRVIMWLLPVAALSGQFLPGRDHLLRLSLDVLSAMAGTSTELLAPAGPAFRVLGATVLFLIIILFLGYGARMLSFQKMLLILIVFAGASVGIHAAMQYHIQNKYVWLGQAGVEGRGWLAFEHMTPRPATVASVGNERAYPLFGSGLRHRVITVNVDAHPDWQFHDYERAARKTGASPATIERPQFHRENAGPNAWIQNLKKQNVELLFCSTLEPISAQFMKTTPDGFPIEVEWIRRRPAQFRLMFRIAGARPYPQAVEIYAFNQDF
jgi:hypothetical protein